MLFDGKRKLSFGISLIGCSDQVQNNLNVLIQIISPMLVNCDVYTTPFSGKYNLICNSPQCDNNDTSLEYSLCPNETVAMKVVAYALGFSPDGDKQSIMHTNTSIFSAGDKKSISDAYGSAYTTPSDSKHMDKLLIGWIVFMSIIGSLCLIRIILIFCVGCRVCTGKSRIVNKDGETSFKI